MRLQRFFFAVLGLLACHQFAIAQAPGVIYTWNGTGNIWDWGNGLTPGQTSGSNVTTVTNTIPGELTITEMGDPIDGSASDFALTESYGRRLDSSNDNGGLDVTGLSAIEMDISHNGTDTVNVQFFAQVTPGYTFVTGNADGTLGRGTVSQPYSPNWSIGPGLQTIRIPINQSTPGPGLTAAEQAYIIGMGIKVASHVTVGNLTWTIKEVRSVGTPLTTRDIATHDDGTSNSGLNGAYINFERTAVMGNDGSAQAGLTQHTVGGVGSLTWTDLGGSPGAAIAWGNGTAYDIPAGGNSYVERPLSADNYNRVTFRMKATDPLGGGGTLSVQSYFQNENYSSYQNPGTQNLPIDGAYHDLTFRIDGVTGMRSIDAFGFNLGTHPNDAVIDVDLVRFTTVPGLPGDYNGDGFVNAADYVAWRAFPGLFGGDPIGYNVWRSNFGTSASGSIGPGAVPEPSSIVLLVSMLLGCIAASRKVV